MANFISSVLLLLIPIITCSGCPFGTPWRLHDDFCYRKYDEDLGWLEAHEYCRSLDGQLAIIQDEATYNHVNSLTGPEEFWIGLRDFDTNPGVFSWSNGNALGGFSAFQITTDTTVPPTMAIPIQRFIDRNDSPMVPDTPRFPARRLASFHDRTNFETCVLSNGTYWFPINCTTSMGYACQTYNMISSVVLNVSDVTPYYGETIELNCHALPYGIVTTTTFPITWEEVEGSEDEETVYHYVTESISPRCSAHLNELTKYWSPRVNIVPRELPDPTIARSQNVPLYHAGSTEIFACQMSVFGISFTGYRWIVVNGTETESPLDNTFSTNSSFTTLPLEFSGNINISCAMELSNTTTEFSQPLTVHVIDFAPRIIAYPVSRQYFFIGNTYVFICISSAMEIVPDNYKWKVDSNEYDTDVNSTSIEINTENQNISCAIEGESVISYFTDPVDVSFINMPKPNVTSNNDYFYVGNTYTFNCISSLVDFEFPAFVWFIVQLDANVAELTGQLQTVSQEIRMNNAGTVSISCATREVTLQSQYSEPFTASVIEIPQPAVVSDALGPYHFISTTYNFSCNSLLDPVEVGLSPNYVWRINETLEDPSPNYIIQELFPTQFDISCGIQADDVVQYSETIHIEIIDFPMPTLVPMGHGPYLFEDINNTYSCNSPVHESVQYYTWFLDGSEIGSSALPSIRYTVSSVGSYTMHCTSTIGIDSVESQSESVMVEIIEVPRPQVVVLGNPDFFVLGRQYTTFCQSEVSQYVTHIEFNNNGALYDFDTDYSGYVINAAGEVQEIHCYVSVDDAFSPASETIDVIGSDIQSISAQASNLNPYPGTSVNLDCIITMVDGHTDEEVSFSWVVNGEDVASTRTHTLYVSTGSTTSTFCRATSNTTNVTVSSNVLSIAALELPSPSLAILNNEPTDGLFEVGNFYYFLCQSPSVEDLITKYRWLNHSQVFEETDDGRIIIKAMSTTNNYTCEYFVNEEVSGVSNFKQVRTKSILSVQIVHDGEFQREMRPVFNTLLTLTCQATLKTRITHDPDYYWTAQSIEIDSGQQYAISVYPGYVQTIQCVVTVGDDHEVSDPVQVIGQSTPSRPVVIAMTDIGNRHVRDFQSGNSYMLECFYNSKSDNSTITWIKDDVVIPCATESKLPITRFRPDIHEGNIQCQIGVLGMTSVSEPLQVTE